MSVDAGGREVRGFEVVREPKDDFMGRPSPGVELGQRAGLGLDKIRAQPASDDRDPDDLR